MQVEVGAVVEGTVTGITKFGAFVSLPDGRSGLVHISEIANTYVSEIRDHLTENQQVKVKVIGINEAGKVSLSIKKAVENPLPQGQNQNRNNNRRRNDAQRSKPNVWEPKKTVPMSELSFEDMLTRFKQNSEERMCDLKRSTDRKNGSRRK